VIVALAVRAEAPTRLGEELLDEVAELAERPQARSRRRSSPRPADAAAFARVVLLASALTCDRKDVDRAVDQTAKGVRRRVLAVGLVGIGCPQLALAEQIADAQAQHRDRAAPAASS
jgi:hypothetical protein